jgi:hypothetical protein
VPLYALSTVWYHFFFTRAARARVDKFWSWSPPSTASSIIIKAWAPCRPNIVELNYFSLIYLRKRDHKLILSLATKSYLNLRKAPIS